MRQSTPPCLARRPPRLPDAGFILVETIVTLAISAFLLVALTALISFVAQSFNRVAARSSDLEVRSRLLAAITRDISLAQRTTFAGDGMRFVFRGTSTQLVFVEPVMNDGLENLRVVELGGDQQLIRKEAELPPAANDFADLAFGTSTTLLVDGLRLRFAYFGQAGPGVETLSGDWLETDRMPVAIRVSLLDTDDRAVFPGLRVPLIIDAEPGCASPTKSNCSFLTEIATTVPADAKPDLGSGGIDPNDSQGWFRYAR